MPKDKQKRSGESGSSGRPNRNFWVFYTVHNICCSNILYMCICHTLSNGKLNIFKFCHVNRPQ